MQQQWSPFLIEISSPTKLDPLTINPKQLKRFVNDSSGYFSTLMLLSSVSLDLCLVTFIPLYADRCIADIYANSQC